MCEWYGCSVLYVCVCECVSEWDLIEVVDEGLCLVYGSSRRLKRRASGGDVRWGPTTSHVRRRGKHGGILLLTFHCWLEGEIGREGGKEMGRDRERK